MTRGSGSCSIAEGFVDVAEPPPANLRKRYVELRPAQEMTWTCRLSRLWWISCETGEDVSSSTAMKRSMQAVAAAAVNYRRCPTLLFLLGRYHGPRPNL